MDYDVLKAFVNNEIEPYLQNIEMWQCIMALGIKPFKVGKQWRFLCGINIQEGICGFGDTIDKAAWDFYTNLKSKKKIMKVLSVKEKAKAYDNIIEKANKMHSENCEACQMCIEELIPELAESDDEKISKALVKYFTSRISNPDYEICGVSFKKVVDWLEKQGEKDEEIIS